MKRNQCGTKITGVVKLAKKKLFLRGWFILLVGLAVTTVGCGRSESGGSGSETTKSETTSTEKPSPGKTGRGEYNWPEDLILGNMLPAPSVNRLEVSNNSADILQVRTLRSISDNQWKDYVERCKENGFILEKAVSDDSDDGYNGYNGEGYKLSLEYNIDMDIRLEAPMMEMTTINWPTSMAGNLLPVPKSLKGSFDSERDDGFLVYISDTTKEDYNEYVTACSAKGFQIDYDKRQNSYCAQNGDGWQLALSHKESTMSIAIQAPKEDDSNTDTSVSPTPKSVSVSPTKEPVSVSSSKVSKSGTTGKKTKKNKKNSNGGLDSDFKKAMDSYEEFIDEYIKFMKKYTANPTDPSILSDYGTYMKKYKKLNNQFHKMKKEDMSEDEWVYYLKVLNRVVKKLSKIND